MINVRLCNKCRKKKKQRGRERKVKVSVKSRGSTKKQTNQEGRVNKLPPSKEIGQAGRKKKIHSRGELPKFEVGKFAAG